MASTTKKSTTARTATSTRKTRTTKSASTPPAEAAPAPAPVVIEAAQPVVSGPALRKKELIDAVVARSGIKKKDAKPVVEAMLDVLGEALGEGRELNLQPMGNIKVKRAKELSNAKVMVTRVRQSKGTPTAEAAE
ncbi:MAG: HU family DNA-binding protein [Pseudomonadota bacterium]